MNVARMRKERSSRNGYLAKFGQCYIFAIMERALGAVAFGQTMNLMQRNALLLNDLF